MTLPEPEHPEYNYGLWLIAQDLLIDDRTLCSFGLSEYTHNWVTASPNPLILVERDYDMDNQQQQSDFFKAQLNADQRIAYDKILSTIQNNTKNAQFYLHSAGGTGKTFVYRALCAYLHT